jgi:hypothetical protein
VETHGLAQGQFLNVWFDDGAIGLRLCDDGDASMRAHALKLSTVSGSLGLSCRGFARQFEIQPGKFSAAFDAEKKMIVLTRVTEQP